MPEGMTELDVKIQEERNTGTAWTRNDSFEKNGYLVIKDLLNPMELYCPVPERKGNITILIKTPNTSIMFQKKFTGRWFYLSILVSTVS